MKLQGATTLVTGVGIDNLGHHFVEALLQRGAKRVYATARRPELITIPGVEVLPLDLGDDESVSAAAARAQDVDVLINNAALFAGQLSFLGSDIVEIRRLFDTNLFGTLRVIRAFAPILAANGGGAILDVLSAAAWSHSDGVGVYGASKAATWRMTESLRYELAPQGTQVSGLLFGMAGTPALKLFADALAGPGVLDAMMTSPAEIVRIALDGMEAGQSEIVGDQLAVNAKAALTEKSASTDASDA